jgi:arginase
MTPVELILVPYSLGREGESMGAGPVALRADAEELLRPRAVRRLSLAAAFENEIGACFDLNRQVAAAVEAAVGRGSLPVVMTGNCHTQQAVVAGLGADGLGLAWFDCHADFHTPETTASGFFDGTALAMTVGHCWAALCATVPGFAPVAEERVVLVGARDLEDGERARLARSAIAQVAAADVGAALAADRVSLHLDLDVLDADAVGRANAFAAPGGLGAGELREAVEAIFARTRVEAVTISAYDPAHDAGGGVRRALRGVLEAVAAAA